MPGTSGKQREKGFEKDEVTMRKKKGSQQRGYPWLVDHCSQLPAVCCRRLVVLFEVYNGIMNDPRLHDRKVAFFQQGFE
jgi:hypothetical protein